MPVIDNHTLVTHIRDDLKAWGAKHHVGLYVSIASTMRRALELLATPPNGLFLIVLWDGEEDVGSMAISGIVDQAFSVLVLQQASLSVVPGQDIMEEGAGGAPGLLARVNQVRDRVRGLTFPDGETDVYPWYKRGSQMYDASEVPVPLNAFRLQFTLHTALPQPDYHTWLKPAS